MSTLKALDLTRAEELAAIRRMFSESDHVICPICMPDGWGTWNHLQKPLHIKGGDDYKAEKAFGMGVRGDVLALPFEGECGHTWALVFGYHKGHICFKLVAYEGPTAIDDYLSAYDVYEDDVPEDK